MTQPSEQPSAAAAGDDGVVHVLARDHVMMLALARREVAGRQAADLVQDVDQHGGAVGRQALAGNRVILERLGEYHVGGLEGGRVDQRNRARTILVDGDELDALGAHDRHRGHRDRSCAACLPDHGSRCSRSSSGSPAEPMVMTPLSSP